MRNSECGLRRRQLNTCQSRFECAEKTFLLPDDGIRRGQLFFQGQAGLRLGEAQDAPAAGELDEVELNFIAVNHSFIVLEIRGIATGDPKLNSGKKFPSAFIPKAELRRDKSTFI